MGACSIGRAWNSSASLLEYVGTDWKCAGLVCFRKEGSLHHVSTARLNPKLNSPFLTLCCCNICCRYVSCLSCILSSRSCLNRLNSAGVCMRCLGWAVSVAFLIAASDATVSQRYQYKGHWTFATTVIRTRWTVSYRVAASVRLSPSSSLPYALLEQESDACYSFSVRLSWVQKSCAESVLVVNR